MADLPPLPQPTGVFTSFIAQQTEVIVVDEKGLSLSGDSFNITLANGTPLLKVQGKVFSFRQRKAVSDVAGNHLCTIRSKASSLIRQTYWVEDPSEKFIMEVKFSASKCMACPMPTPSQYPLCSRPAKLTYPQSSAPGRR